MTNIDGGIMMDEEKPILHQPIQEVVTRNLNVNTEIKNMDDMVSKVLIDQKELKIMEPFSLRVNKELHQVIDRYNQYCEWIYKALEQVHNNPTEFPDKMLLLARNTASFKPDTTDSSPLLPYMSPLNGGLLTARECYQEAYNGNPKDYEEFYLTGIFTRHNQLELTKMMQEKIARFMIKYPEYRVKVFRIGLAGYKVCFKIKPKKTSQCTIL